MTDDRFEWPPAWRRRVLPRRGGVRAVPPDPAPEADPAVSVRRGNRMRVALERRGWQWGDVREGDIAASELIRDMEDVVR